MDNSKKFLTYKEPVLSTFQDLLEQKTGMGLQRDLLKYASWVGVPPQFRKTQSEEDFRRQNGISELMLASLKRHPQLNILIVETTCKWVIGQMPTVVGALTERVLENANEQDVHTFVMVVRLLEDIKRERLL